MGIIREINEIIDRTGIDAEVSTYLFKRGHIAKNVDPLLNAIEECYQGLFNDKLPKVTSEVTSMWRDLNIYNEVGIPAVTFELNGIPTKWSRPNTGPNTC
jgi:hypothetical protein